MARKSHATFMDVTANNETIAENAEVIVSLMVVQDFAYFEQKIYGDPLYLRNVQQSTGKAHLQNLLPVRSRSAARSGSAQF